MKSLWEMSHNELVEHCSEQEFNYEDKISRLRRYSDESVINLNERFDNEVKTLKVKVWKSLPIVEEFHKFDLHYYKDSTIIGDQHFALLKNGELSIEYYQLGRQIFPLPNELKKKLRVAYLAIFDTNQVFSGFGLLNYRLEGINTFHTSPISMCLGSNNKAIYLPKMKKPKTIIQGFESVMETLKVVNPSSYLHSGLEIPKSLRPIQTFVDEKFAEHRRQHRGSVCPNCEDNVENCECPWCDDCDHHEDNCTCDDCSDCGEHIDDCNCERCPNCNYRIESNNFNICVCSRCRNCGILEGDCGCTVENRDIR